MSVIYCKKCDGYVDTDYDVEHTEEFCPIRDTFPEPEEFIKAMEWAAPMLSLVEGLSNEEIKTNFGEVLFRAKAGA